MRFMRENLLIKLQHRNFNFPRSLAVKLAPSSIKHELGRSTMEVVFLPRIALAKLKQTPSKILSSNVAKTNLFVCKSFTNSFGPNALQSGSRLNNEPNRSI